MTIRAADASIALVIDTLRATPLWSVATDDVLLAAASQMTSRHYQDGELLIRQGAPGAALLVLVEGSVNVSINTPEGGTTVVARLGRGESVGEMSLLTGDPASADVIADGPVEALALSTADFAGMIGSNAGLLRQFVTILAKRLSTTDLEVGSARAKEQDLTEFLREADAWDDDVVGKSPPIRALRKSIAQFAGGTAPVLVRGEDGTGRELVARLLHRQSPRSDALVIGVDCTLIAESEWGDKLFGAIGGGSGHALSYVDLARGGTLVLKSLERLPAEVQRRLIAFLGESGQAANVRILATSGVGMRQPLPELVAVFEERTIDVAPLRERKRDIPLLAERFLSKHATRLGRAVTALDDDAVKRLVSYDYRIANDRELEQAIERAVTLCDGDVVEAETIFLGPPPPPRRGAFDLLSLPIPNIRKIVTTLPRVARIGAAAFFAFLIALSFLGPSEAEGNLVTTLVWSLWWPVLVLSFFFVGRAWCAVCPMGLVTTLGERFRPKKQRIPTWLKKHDVKIAMAGLFLIVLVEEASGMRHSPVLTGLLLTTILGGAAITGFMYPRRTWCRHICPLGGMAGACATSGLIELRPSFDICSAKCTGHTCFKGDEHVPGCPMFNHVMFVDTNQHCVLCMNCVSSCPNDSPQLNVRLPGREIWNGTAATPGLGQFVLLLSGLLAAMTLVQRMEAGPADMIVEHRVLTVTLLLAAGAALPLLLASPLRRSAAMVGAEAESRFWNRVSAFAPLVTAGFICFQLAYLPGVTWLHASLDIGDGAGETSRLSVAVLDVVRFTALSIGLLVSAAILWRAESRDALPNGEIRNRWRDRWPLLGLVGYWGGLLCLMLLP